MNRPNFIVFLTDDQGYGDLSCMGAKDFSTPHLDDLAAIGVRFTSWYSNSPVCSPSRAALLTGRYPGNTGVRSILPGMRSTPGLPPNVPTLATALRKVGYRTAMFGKWHLGLAPESRPHNHGFDTWFGFMAGCIDYYSHIFYWGRTNPLHDLWENNQEIHEDGRYFTELITERSIAYVRQAAQRNEPFFMYVPYNAPHYPMHAPKRYLDRFAHLPWDRQIMAAMISAVDDSIGAIVAELKRQHLLDNTCIVFTSDNGPSRESRNWLDGCPDPYYGGSAGIFKGHKFSLFEGGIRMPAIMSWPSRIPAGQVCDQPVASMDVFPTFLSAAGGDTSTYELDGLDILPVVKANAPSPHQEIFWELGKQTAVRRGPWKLVLNGQVVGSDKPSDEVFLSNLESDISEELNLKDSHPNITQQLTQAALAWRERIEQRWENEWKAQMEA